VGVFLAQAAKGTVPERGWIGAKKIVGRYMRHQPRVAAKLIIELLGSPPGVTDEKPDLGRLNHVHPDHFTDPLDISAPVNPGYDLETIVDLFSKRMDKKQAVTLNGPAKIYLAVKIGKILDHLVKAGFYRFVDDDPESAFLIVFGEKDH